jgi:hypothetical protein
VEFSCNRQTLTDAEQSESRAAAIVTNRGKAVRNHQRTSKIPYAQDAGASLSSREIDEIQKIVAAIQRKSAERLGAE